MRAASLAELGRRLPGEPQGRAWAVSIVHRGRGRRCAARHRRRGARRGAAHGAHRGRDRAARPDGRAPPSALADARAGPAVPRRRGRAAAVLRPAGVRRRADPRRPRRRPTSGRCASAPGCWPTSRPIRAWLTALEARMAEAGARMAEARAATLARPAGRDRPARRPALPARRRSASPATSSNWRWAARRSPRSRRAWPPIWPLPAPRRGGRTGADRSAPGRSGRRSRLRGRPAAECSTGEQKALILNLVLAQAARLSRAKSQPNPILLLDEVAAHLDLARRAALAEEIEALGLQAFLTGTDEALFEPLKGRALGVRVDASRLIPLES